jgi:flagellar basal-body rod modification protein FlgD
MITNSISSAYSGTTSNSNNVTDNSGSERNMFLTLLVAQLKNQDPLAPQDGAQFVAQLAQFNSLDQLIGIRNSIEQLTTLLNQSQKPSAS